MEMITLVAVPTTSHKEATRLFQVDYLDQTIRNNCIKVIQISQAKLETIEEADQITIPKTIMFECSNLKRALPLLKDAMYRKQIGTNGKHPSLLMCKMKSEYLIRVVNNFENPESSHLWKSKSGKKDLNDILAVIRNANSYFQTYKMATTVRYPGVPVIQ